MYCSTCGVAVAQGLSFCNYCGAKLIHDDKVSKTKELRPESLIFGMLATFVFGLVGITLMMGMMKAVLLLPVEQILACMLVPFAIMLVLEGVFIRLLLRRSERAELTAHSEPAKGPVTNELNAAPARALSEARPSVTEHTTRAFEPIVRTK